MQLASLSFAASTPAPTFTGGIDFVSSGTGSRFRSFSAHATDVVVGDAAGYATLREAMDELTMATIGNRLPAAGVFEHDGRFYGRRLDNKLTFASGASWEGVWRLEQYPQDRELLGRKVKHGVTTRSEALRAVVDGAQRVRVTHLPVRAADA